MSEFLLFVPKIYRDELKTDKVKLLEKLQKEKCVERCKLCYDKDVWLHQESKKWHFNERHSTEYKKLYHDTNEFKRQKNDMEFSDNIRRMNSVVDEIDDKDVVETKTSYLSMLLKEVIPPPPPSPSKLLTKLEFNSTPRTPQPPTWNEVCDVISDDSQD